MPAHGARAGPIPGEGAVHHGEQAGVNLLLDAQQIDQRIVDHAVGPVAVTVQQSAKGILIFPSVVKAGLVIGGEHGEGSLRVNGKTVDYYATSAASFGFQAGVQSKSILILFMTSKALADFRASKGFEVGVTGSVAVIKQGAGGEIDTSSVKDPIAAFIFGNKGLMVDASLEGSKYTKLDK